MTPLEKAARALWEDREQRMPERVRTPWPKGTHLATSYVVADVIAVLRAIREPSDEMIEVAYEQFDWGPPDYHDAPQGSASAAPVWQAMIDTILGDTP